MQIKLRQLLTKLDKANIIFFMTTKKLLIILIVSVLSLLTAGLTIFFVTSKSKIIYANSITANKEQIDLFVGDEFYIFDKIKFDIKPQNCTQSIKFSVSDISVCSLEASTRKIKARKIGTCNLRASVKNSENEYISTNILIRVFDKDNPLEIFATDIQINKKNVILKVGENINLSPIFEILPQNCTQNAEILFDYPNICTLDKNTNQITATSEGICVVTIKIKSSTDSYISKQVNIIVCENQKMYSFDKTLEFDNNQNNIFVINITEDLPELAGLGKIDFETVFDQNVIEIIENEANIYKILCKSAGNFEIIFANSGYSITYNLNATTPNLLLNTTLSTNTISLQVGDMYNLNNLQFESLPDEFELTYSLSNTNAKIEDNILTATNIGNCILTINIFANGNNKKFEVDIEITKRIVNYQATSNTSKDFIQIDLYQDQIVKSIAPTFVLQNVFIENESIVSKENLTNNILTLSILDKGTTNLSIESNLVEIIVSVTIK